MTVLEFMQNNPWLTIALACIAAFTIVSCAEVFTPYAEEVEDDTDDGEK